jgi:sRNA-binding regulator protein Hfq
MRKKPSTTVHDPSRVAGEGGPPHRKLIRPNLAELKERLPARPWRKQAPPEQTNAESFYYLKQMNAKTPMVFVLTDGEVVRGTLEWYDRNCLKVNRQDGPNLLLMKHSLKYVYKEVGGDG